MKAEKSINKIVGQPQTSRRDHPYLATKYYLTIHANDKINLRTLYSILPCLKYYALLCTSLLNCSHCTMENILKGTCRDHRFLGAYYTLFSLQSTTKPLNEMLTFVLVFPHHLSLIVKPNLFSNSTQMPYYQVFPEVYYQTLILSSAPASAVLA